MVINEKNQLESVIGDWNSNTNGIESTVQPYAGWYFILSQNMIKTHVSNEF